MQNSRLHDMKHHPDGSLKIIMVFSAWVNLSAGALYTK